MSVFGAMAAVAAREVRLALRSPGDALQPLVFYGLVAAVFPLGVVPNDPSLARYAPAILWTAALLASLMTLERVFRADFEDGSLEQLALGPLPLALAITAKLAAHWLIGGLLLALLAWPLGLGLGLPAHQASVLAASLLLGTPTLIWVGGFAAALTVGLPRAGVLLPILVLPMLAPVMIFGTGAVRAAAEGLDAAAPLYFLGALLVLSLTLIPFAAAAALRNALES